MNYHAKSTTFRTFRSLFNETHKEINNNLVIWQVFIWLFGKFSFGYLACFHLVIWQVFVWLFGMFSFGYLAKLPKYYQRVFASR